MSVKVPREGFVFRWYRKNWETRMGREDRLTRKEKKAARRARANQRILRRRRILMRIFLLFLILAAIIGTYFYYMINVRGKQEPGTQVTATTAGPLYSLKDVRAMLNLTPTVKRAAFQGRAAEIDYGTYVVPGLEATKTQIFREQGTFDMCTSMTPQGLCVTEEYLIISAYCHSGTHNSVLYVVDKTTHEYVKTIVLRNKAHVGGLAYDPIHSTVWISGMSGGIPQVNALTLKQIKEYRFAKEYKAVSYSQSYDLYAINRNSFLTYYNNCLYIGYFTDNSASVLEEYRIGEDGTLVTQTLNDSLGTGVSSVGLTPLALPSDTRVITKQAQGVAFYKDMLLFSHSYGILPSSLSVYKNSIQKLLEESTMLQKIRFPGKMEQIYVDGDDMYVLFESAAYCYRYTSLTRIDRVLKVNLKTLLNYEE